MIWTKSDDFSYDSDQLLTSLKPRYNRVIMFVIGDVRELSALGKSERIGMACGDGTGEPVDGKIRRIGNRPPSFETSWHLWNSENL